MKKLSKYLGMLIFMILGGVCGILMAKYGISEMENLGLGEFLFMMSICLVLLYMSMFVQIVIHEAGHLVFGLLSGYQFSSFRILSFMWVKKNGKISLKRLNIAGTGGQCLMSPPDMVDGKYPVFLYNIGGCIANILAGILFFAISFAVRDIKYVFIGFRLLAMIGIGFAVANGVPIMGTVNNDGHNALSLGKSKEGMKAFWITMKVNDLISTHNMRLKDMPEELFYMPQKEHLDNALIASIGVYYCNYLLDAHRFDEAKTSMEYLLENSTGMIELHRILMKMDMAYIHMLHGEIEKAKRIMTDKNVIKVMKSMKKFPSIIRTEYLYTKVCEKEEDKAAKKLELFYNVAKTYPHQADIDSELELMELIQ